MSTQQARRENTLAGVDAEWLSGVIASIYDCVLEPAGWERAIGAIADHFSFANAVLGILPLRSFAHELRVHYRFDDEWLAVADATYIEDTVSLWGGQARIQAYPLDEPVIASDVTPIREWSRFRYWREILEPRQMIDAAVTPLAREPDLIGYFGLNRHADAGPIRREELDGLRLIMPHMRRAVTISKLFDLKAVEAKTFGAVLDGMACAVLLVDQNLRIVHANSAAEALLAAGDLVHSLQGRLKVSSEIAANALETAVQVAAADEAVLGQRGIGIPAKAKDGSPAVLHVLPLERREVRSGLMQRAVAAVFVVDGSGTTYSSDDAVAALYDFTPAESRIFASLCRGKSLDEAATALGIAKSTARTHLLRVFAKTGCKRQAELVALGASLSPRL